MKKINLITKEVLEKVEPSKKDLEIIKNSLKEFKQRFEAEIKKAKLNVKIFVGGSFAKKTIKIGRAHV